MHQGHGEPVPPRAAHGRLLALAHLAHLGAKRSFWHQAQFDTIRLALIKVAARVTEMVTRIRLALPSSYPYRRSFALLACRATRPP